MSWIGDILGFILPRDPSSDCGYGPFKLPHDHPFTRGCELHDFSFDSARVDPEHTGTRAEQDSALFYRWTLIARAAATPEEQCALMMDIAEYWPMARRFGGLLWKGRG